MAKIKIREGSLKVELQGKNGSSHGTLDDPNYTKGEKVRVWFDDYNTRYTFRDGRLISNTGIMRDPSSAENTFKLAAGVLTLTWAAAVAVQWFIVSWSRVQAGGGLADIPSGLAVIVTALTAGAGFNRYVAFRERTS